MNDGSLRIRLTAAQARGLLALAEGGAEELLADKETAAAYVGPPPSQRAARRALCKLRGELYPGSPPDCDKCRG